MKKTLAFFLIVVLLLSAVGLTFAETGETQEPKIEKPVRIKVVDETGAAVTGAQLQLSDAEGHVFEACNLDHAEQTFFLKEGTYSIESIAVPAAYYADETEPVQISVELTPEETVTDYIGTVTYDHDHPEICNRANHVGLELYTVGPEHTVAYCINHGLKNPTADSRYKMLVATPEVLFTYALNKSDDITAEELYKHVMGIMYGGYDYARNLGFDDAVSRYLTYMALKKYTDPKKFTTYNDEGVFVNGDGTGTPLGSIINHAKQERHALPEGFVEAYQTIVEMTEYPSDYILYLYYPDNFNGDNAFQCLLSVKQVETKTVTVAVQNAAPFEITVKWDDAQNTSFRPTPAALQLKLKLLADNRDVTRKYHDNIQVTDNGDGTYTVRVGSLPRRNANLKEISYKLRFNSVPGYKSDKTYAKNGETVVYKVNPLLNKPQPGGHR